MLILTAANSTVRTATDLKDGDLYTLDTTPGVHSRRVGTVQRHPRNDAKILIIGDHEQRPMEKTRQIRIWNGPQA